ncbi:MAG: hypothetical protein ACTHMY_22835 [Solirubrobacteraceae bacterium]
MVGRPRRPPKRNTARLTLLVALVTLLAGIGLTVARAAVRAATSRSIHPGALRFGIYPGGGVGTIGPGAISKPDDPAKRLAALEKLNGGHPFVLHVFVDYTGRGGASATQQARRELVQYERAGFQIELVLCYRPVGGGARVQVAGFARFVRDAVASLGASRRLVSVQVTNEANVAGADNATDGSHPAATDALIAGVIAAKHEARALGHTWVKVGFNLAYATDPGQASFFRYLHRHGRTAFARAVDWVGLDVYPGTWGPPIDPAQLGQATRAMMRSALHRLRRRYMPLAGLLRHVAIHVSENGYPTGPGRTPAMQETAMRAAITAIFAVSREYNVSDYRWFDLRDASSAGPSFEDQYGLLYDNYSPKPAFGLYRELIAAYSVH